MEKKYVYMFEEGNTDMNDLLGGKGANLAEMTNLGLPIPPGFTVTTEACALYNSRGKILAKRIKNQVDSAMKSLEEKTGKKFGDTENPLLVSVRSGSKSSMPGMMDTVLNLGLNDETVKALAKSTDNTRFAYDSYRRFITMFSDTVMGISKEKLDRTFDRFKDDLGVENDVDLDSSQMKVICQMLKKIYRDEQGQEFPQDTKDQLYAAIGAVFQSWDNERAFVYRRMYDIPYDWGTAVNIQSMVFGNLGDDSGTGVIFSRSPSSGDNVIFGEYMINAQGEDVVAGIRTPKPIAQLIEEKPHIYEEMHKNAKLLESHYRDMQDIEITVERDKLYFLQTRNGKRTATASLKIAMDMVKENIITKEEALLRVDPKQLDALLHPVFDQNAIETAVAIGKGLPASPGAASGKVYFTSDETIAAAEKGEKVILVRLETSPDDISAMQVCAGILTVKGGMTSHAAVVARGMGICCVSGCEDIKMNFAAKKFVIDGKEYSEGDVISIDGNTGKIYGEAIATVEPEITGDFATFMEWADERRTLKIRTNADTPKDAQKARDFGAEGIGLTRSEHMFFERERLLKMQQMIFSNGLSNQEIEDACNALLPFQKSDYMGIFEAMNGFPVTIRLLDPPLHEFLPRDEEDYEIIALRMSKLPEELREYADSIHEVNPMMGHRGLRLSVSVPQLTVMQTTAIIEAGLECQKKGIIVLPEIMIPLSTDIKELNYVKEIIETTATGIFKREGTTLEYIIGTMIETPRACMVADQMATEAEFFSFGTNDLTQLTYGLSRDDAGKILAEYLDKKIFEADPYARLDQNGVGGLVKIAVEQGRRTRPEIKLGICGEHGGDPSSIEFFHNVGLDYVSCSPFRVPIARLAAAQAAIKEEQKGGKSKGLVELAAGN